MSTALALMTTGGLAPATESLASSPREHVPPTRYLLVGGMGSANVGVLAVDREGTTSNVPGSPFLTGTGLSLVITPDARAVYVASMAGAITGYHIGSDGALTPIDGAQIVVGSPVAGLAMAPDGAHMFATIGGEVRSFSIASSGALTPAGATQAPGQSTLSLPAITPDGRHLFVSDFLNDVVTSFAIASDAGLVQVGQPVPTGSRPALPGITPDGRFLYVSNEGTGDLSGYAIARDGTLTPTPGGRYPTGGTPHGTAITPDGRRLYVPDASPDGNIHGFQIGDDGALTPLAGSPHPGPGGGAIPGRIVLSPDARRAFVIEALTPNVTSKVHSYAIAPDGTPTPTGQPPANSGVLFSDGPSSEITPNQGPAAALRIVGAEGPTHAFSAAGATDSDGTITRYDWDFGDGTSATTTTPEITHTFDQPGMRTVTVTVTDDEGCSLKLIHTGQVTTCNGGPLARATQEISVP
ncbi:beta-propeller fold lactonase family protein [Saccharopolyspora sp. TS4A08]|uniref:Beta-propeller fold lactonase family protein n=1 Tax=Saccharopolyspora ipomoeae TaxID=3042027 RepID=A0ABT6PUV3_9PSEU|nr:PKD domain-containing protein [Saccharopolyspora sp. TS4A08]MDI2031779.1 beta-propeller fold lactonase family protein [Saccharopolyspora sp. TS4A08]